MFINYLHSRLKSTDPHFIELVSALKEEGIDIDRELVIENKLEKRHEVSRRKAIYLTRLEWEIGLEDARYFDSEGNEISQEELSYLKGPVFKEQLQYDLLIRINDEEELRSIIKKLRKTTAKFKLNKKGSLGKKPYKQNLNQISNAWEIPLLLCTTKGKKPKNLDDFLKVYEFIVPEQVGGTNLFLSTLCRKKKKTLEQELKGIDSNVNIRYALRAFIEQYIDI